MKNNKLHHERDARKRLDSQYTIEPFSGCWLWEGAVDGYGYGLMMLNGIQRQKAHRASWILHKGEIPGKMCVCHRCDTPLCVNPNHLFLGTSRDNAMDRVFKGRPGNPPKLTVDQVQRIRTESGTKQSIADKYGISLRHVFTIRSRKAWWYVP